MKYKKDIYTCKYCGKECIGLSGLHFHENRCKENPNRKEIIIVNNNICFKRIPKNEKDKYIKDGWKLGFGNFASKFAGPSPKGKIFITDGNKTRLINKDENIPVNWYRGITFHKPNTGKCKDPIKEQERRKKISLKMKGKPQCTYHEGCGKGKKGWYKGIFCDSTWELAYVIYCIDHNIKIERNKQMFDYEYNGEIHKYLPDFIINGQLVEVKGWKDPKWLVKEKVFRNIKIIDKDEIQQYIDYVKSTYNCKELVDMYEYRNKKEFINSHLR